MDYVSPPLNFEIASDLMMHTHTKGEVSMRIQQKLNPRVSSSALSNLQGLSFYHGCANHLTSPCVISTLSDAALWPLLLS